MTNPAFSLDLTQRPPRSCYARLGGYVILPRLIDKVRAEAAGKLGEYYAGINGMNGRFLSFVGIGLEAFKAQVLQSATDLAVLQWVEAHATHPRGAWDIAAWSDYQAGRVVDSDPETLEGFAASMRTFNPEREDIKTRFDFLDLDDYCSFGGQA